MRSFCPQRNHVVCACFSSHHQGGDHDGQAGKTPSRTCARTKRNSGAQGYLEEGRGITTESGTRSPGYGRGGRALRKAKYFLPELVMAGEMLNGITDIVRQTREQLPQPKRGKVLIGTSKGDINDSARTSSSSCWHKRVRGQGPRHRRACGNVRGGDQGL